jgi:hypothetical protein
MDAGRIGSLFFSDQEPSGRHGRPQSGEIDEALVAEFPRDAEYRRAFLMRANNLGVILTENRDFEAADVIRKRALELAEQSYAEHHRTATPDMIWLSFFRILARFTPPGDRPKRRPCMRAPSKSRKGWSLDSKHRICAMNLRRSGARPRNSPTPAVTSPKRSPSIATSFRHSKSWRAKLRGSQGSGVTGQLHRKIGRARVPDGNSVRGLAAMERAVEIYQTLAKELPNRPEFRLSVASSG